MQNSEKDDGTMDVHSPYIKKGFYSLDEARKNINKKNHNDYVSENENVLNIKSILRDRESSDTILEKKIKILTKKIVGEEIKKIVDILNQELIIEFDNLEEKIKNENNKNINFIEQKMYDNINKHKTTIANLEYNVITKLTNFKTDFKEEIDKENKLYINNIKNNVENIELELHKKLNSLIEIINIKLKELEEKVEGLKKQISVLGILDAVELKKEIEEIKNIVLNNKKEDKKEMEEIKKELLKSIEKPTEEKTKNKLTKSVKRHTESTKNKENKIINDSLTEYVEKGGGTSKTKEKKEDYIDKIDREKYIKNKYDDIVIQFKESGIIFSENTYKTKLKNLEVEEFLNYKDSISYIRKDFIDNISNILISFMDKLGINPAEEETIDQFILRALENEYSLNKNN